MKTQEIYERPKSKSLLGGVDLTIQRSKAYLLRVKSIANQKMLTPESQDCNFKRNHNCCAINMTRQTANPQYSTTDQPVNQPITAQPRFKVHAQLTCMYA